MTRSGPRRRARSFAHPLVALGGLLLYACSSPTPSADGGSGGQTSSGGSQGGGGGSGAGSGGQTNSGGVQGSGAAAPAAGGLGGGGGTEASTGGSMQAGGSGGTPGLCTGGDDDGDGVPNGCDACPGFDDENLMEIAGTVRIENQGDLDALEGVGRMPGRVVIGEEFGGLEPWNEISLSSLEPLSCLKEVGPLEIHRVDGLVNVDGLRSLELALDIIIDDNPDLVNVDGFAKISELASNLSVRANPALTNLDGFSALTSVGWDVLIIGNLALGNVDGLSGVLTVGRQLMVSQNPLLADVAGFGSLESAGLAATPLLQAVWIADNETLTDLDGLSSLREIGNGLLINGNAALTRIQGLHGVTSVAGDLIVGDNPLLPTCEAEALRDAIGIANIQGTIQIENNTGSGDCTP